MAGLTKTLASGGRLSYGISHFFPVAIYRMFSQRQPSIFVYSSRCGGIRVEASSIDRRKCPLAPIPSVAVTIVFVLDFDSPWIVTALLAVIHHPVRTSSQPPDHRGGGPARGRQPA